MPRRAVLAQLAALAWGFAQGEAGWGRQTRAEVEALVESTSAKDQIQAMGFGVWDQWTSGQRGRES